MFFISTIDAQVLQKETNSELNLKSVKGTFQIEYLQTEGSPISLTSEFLSLVEKSRKEDEIIYLKLDDKTRVKVFSKKEINSSDSSACLFLLNIFRVVLDSSSTMLNLSVFPLV